MVMTTGEILLYMRTKRGYSLKAVCDGVNNEITTSQLSKTERGVQDSSFTLVKMAAHYLQLPLDLLDDVVNDSDHLEALLKSKKMHTFLVPLLPMERIAAAPRNIANCALSPIFTRAPDNVGESCFAVKVMGNEMVPQWGGLSFPHGTTLFVDAKKEWEEDSLVLAYTENKVTFKQIKRGENGYVLYPLNTQYPVINMDNESFVIGVVIASNQTL